MPTAVASAYQESSQFKRWTLTLQELAERRRLTNTSTIEIVKENIKAEHELSPSVPDKPVEFPNSEEELLIVNYYAAKVFDTGALFNLPSHLKATAAAYVKRFFLFKSSLQYHPKNIMITSLWLATKTCEHHIDLETFVSKLPKQTKDSVLENEFVISATIMFDFVHWSAYRPLYGFVLDMENTMHSQTPDEQHPSAFPPEKVSKMHDTAKSLINACVWSDLPFLHTPSHLALAALYHADREVLQSYLSKKGLADLTQQLSSVAADLEETAAVKFDTQDAMSSVKAADRKLYYAKDPAMKETSALFKKQREAEEEEDEAKRRRKGEASREATEAFGNVLS